MKVIVLVETQPGKPPADAAYQLVKEVLEQQHQVYVFFYADGIYHANLPKEWETLAKHPSLKLIVCSGSLQRRGIWLSSDTPLIIAGLATFMELLVHADKFFQFNKENEKINELTIAKQPELTHENQLMLHMLRNFGFAVEEHPTHYFLARWPCSK